MSSSNLDQPSREEVVPRTPVLPAKGGGQQVRPTAAATLSGAPDAISLLKALRRRWALALSLGIICAAAVGAIAWFVVPPSKYTARALFRVKSDAPRVLFPTGEGRIDLDTYQKNQVAMIKSRVVLEKALGGLDVAKTPTLRQAGGDAVDWLGKELRVAYSGEILTILLVGDRPDDLKALVNAVGEAYQKEVVDKEREARQARFDELKKIYEDYQTRLEAKRKALRSAAELIGSNDKSVMAVKHELALERLSVAERELMGVQSELRRAQAELAMRRPQAAAGTAGPLEAAVEDRLTQDSVAKELRERAARLEAEIAAVRHTARRSNDPAIVRHQRNLSDARKGLDGRREQLLADLRKRGPAASGPAQGAEPLKAQVDMLRELEKVTAQLVQKLADATKSFNRETMGYESLQDEIAHADDAAKKVGNEVEILSVELKAPSRVALIEWASVPRREDEQGPVKLAALASLGAFALVLSGVSWCEFRARRVATIDDVSRGLGLRIVGTLPALPGKARRALAGPGKSLDPAWGRLLIESVDAARTMLLHAARAESHRVVMVTSALGGEGKTSLACHLATSLARAGRRTLLVDCDLRRPAAHRLFGIAAEPGFCDYLRGDCGLVDLVQATPVANLSIIPAGRGDALAIQALAYDETRAAFDWMRQGFDFVVVDTAPVLPVADSLAISEYVDAVLFSILRDVSRMTKVHAAQTQLSQLGVRTLGAIVAGASREAYGSSYSSYLKATQA